MGGREGSTGGEGRGPGIRLERTVLGKHTHTHTHAHTQSHTRRHTHTHTNTHTHTTHTYTCRTGEDGAGYSTCAAFCCRFTL